MRLRALAQAIVLHTCTSRYATFEYQPNDVNKYNHDDPT
jgi:hypothetical protein